MKNPANKLADFYRSFKKEDIAILDQIYSDEVNFIDPVHEMNGLQILSDYFAAMMENVLQCEFDVAEPELAGSDRAFMSWTMTYKHPKLAKGRVITVEGLTEVRWQDKITYHRDYYDLGAMVYEHVPLVGSAVKTIKKRMAG